MKLFYARLNRMRKNSGFERLVSGHDFSRAEKPLIFSPESASADDRKLAQGVFPQPVKACSTQDEQSRFTGQVDSLQPTVKRILCDRQENGAILGIAPAVALAGRPREIGMLTAAA